MATLDQLKQALVNADKAGDAGDARILAQAIRQQQGVAPQQVTPQIPAQEQPQGFLEKAKDIFTGESRTTEEIEALPGLGQLPELNELSLASLKSAFATLHARPEEAAQALQANFPGIETRQDEKGNLIVKSSIDGQEYAVNKPGLDVRDVGRAGLAALEFFGGGALARGAGKALGTAGRVGRALTGVPGQVLGAAGTQAAIEAGEAAGGGEFDIEQIPLAGATELIAPGIGGTIRGVRGLVKGRTGQAFRAVKEGVTEVAPIVPVEKLGLEELGRVAKKAAAGKGIKDIAEQVAPSEEVLGAAKRLGIEEHLQPDHLTSNQAFREMSQAIKSVPASKAKIMEREGIEQVSKKVDDVLTELGATTDFSTLDRSVHDTMEITADKLEKSAKQLYSQLNSELDPKLKTNPSNILNFIEGRIEELDGVKNLSSTEKMIYRKLKPKAVKPKAVLGKKRVPIPVALGGVPVTTTKEALKLPKYSLLDDVRKDLTVAKFKRQGPFKDAQTGLINKLEKELMLDQKNALKDTGRLALFDLAQSTVRTRKSLEQDMASIFGKNLDKNLVAPLTIGIKKLSSGDVSNFVGLIKAVPKEMRKKIAASGLAIALGKNAKKAGITDFSGYNNWFQNLKRNKQAYTALMSNLPEGAAKRLSDLQIVSDAIQKTEKGYIATGRIQAAKDILNGSDGLITNIYNSAKKSAGRAVVSEAATTAIGLPGAGVIGVISGTLAGGKSDVLTLADNLISSSEFLNAVKKIGTPEAKQAVKKLSKTKTMSQFKNKAGNPKEMSDLERWINSSIQSYRQTTIEEGEQ